AVREHVHRSDVDPRGGQRRGDPAGLGTGNRRHLGRDELPVDDRHQIGEGAADVDPDADTAHHAIFPRIGLLRQMGTTKMPSSLEIAQQATLRPIAELAAEIGLEDDEVELYGRFKAKVDLSVLDRLRDGPDAKLIGVTAITPTKAGEGKTTTAVSLTQGLGKISKSPVLFLRDPSLGPAFGTQGGA